MSQHVAAPKAADPEQRVRPSAPVIVYLGLLPEGRPTPEFCKSILDKLGETHGLNLGVQPGDIKPIQEAPTEKYSGRSGIPFDIYLLTDPQKVNYDLRYDEFVQDGGTWIHIHNKSFEFFYFLDDASVVIGKELIPVKAGTLVFADKGVRHATEPDRGPVRTLIIHFPNLRADDYIKDEPPQWDSVRRA